MANDTQLWDLYQEWKRLTQSEGMAILASDWPEVRRCQKAKGDLQPGIIRMTEQAQRELGSAADKNSFEGRIRQVVNELILLESRNNTTLQERMTVVQQERGELDRTTHRLKQVHRSYVPQTGPAWDQYS